MPRRRLRAGSSSHFTSLRDNAKVERHPGDARAPTWRGASPPPLPRRRGPRLRAGARGGRRQHDALVERPVDAAGRHRLDLRRPRRLVPHLRGPARLGDRLRRRLPDPGQRRRPSTGPRSTPSSGNQRPGGRRLRGPRPATGRYVRIYCTRTSQGSDNYSLYDLQVFGTRIFDLAQGRPVRLVGRGHGLSPPAGGRRRQHDPWSSGQWMQRGGAGWIYGGPGCLPTGSPRSGSTGRPPTPSTTRSSSATTICTGPRSAGHGQSQTAGIGRLCRPVRRGPLRADLLHPDQRTARTTTRCTISRCSGRRAHCRSWPRPGA